MTPQMRQLLRERGELVERRPIGDRCWQAARVLRIFDASELAACAECNTAAAQRWIKVLTVAGYMRTAQQRTALVRDTGPLSPLIGRKYRVQDRNNRQEYS